MMVLILLIPSLLESFSNFLLSQMILSRRPEVLSLGCEMSEVHGLLSKIPESLSYEVMVELALQLFQRHPPKKLAQHGRLKLSAR